MNQSSAPGGLCRLLSQSEALPLKGSTDRDKEAYKKSAKRREQHFKGHAFQNPNPLPGTERGRRRLPAPPLRFGEGVGGRGFITPA